MKKSTFLHTLFFLSLQIHCADNTSLPLSETEKRDSVTAVFNALTRTEVQPLSRLSSVFKGAALDEVILKDIPSFESNDKHFRKRIRKILLSQHGNDLIDQEEKRKFKSEDLLINHLNNNFLPETTVSGAIKASIYKTLYTSSNNDKEHAAFLSLITGPNLENAKFTGILPGRRDPSLLSTALTHCASGIRRSFLFFLGAGLFLSAQGMGDRCFNSVKPPPTVACPGVNADNLCYPLEENKSGIYQGSQAFCVRHHLGNAENLDFVADDGARLHTRFIGVLGDNDVISGRFSFSCPQDSEQRQEESWSALNVFGAISIPVLSLSVILNCILGKCACHYRKAQNTRLARSLETESNIPLRSNVRPSASAAETSPPPPYTYKP